MPRGRLKYPRCGPCKRDRKNCSFLPGSKVCEGCLDKGYNCREQTNATSATIKRMRNNFTCDYCRNSHLECNPIDRIWPKKCDYCNTNGLPCSIPKTKRQAEIARAIDEHVISQKSNAEDKLQQTIHVVQEHNASTPISLRLPSASPGSELEDFNSITRSTSPVPQTANRKTGNRDAKLHQPERSELEQLKSVMQTMEDEFGEILKAEQRKRQDEITVLETKHQQELNQLRDRYETRVDSLISIIKSLG